MTKIYNGENCVLGRVLAKAAKEALKGEEVQIYNAEKMIITGNEKTTMAKYEERLSFRDPAKPEHSPKLARRPDLFVKRIVRNMLPKKSARGREAFRRIKIYMGGTKEKAEKISELHKNIRFMTIEKICRYLGWKG